MYRGGGRPIDIYRRIYSGINGTPMPGFAQAFANDPDNIWYLVHFVRDTGERRRRNLPPPATPAMRRLPSSAGCRSLDDRRPQKRNRAAEEVKRRCFGACHSRLRRPSNLRVPMSKAVEQKQRELADLEARAQQLQRELVEEAVVLPFQPQGYYAAYYATTGFMLGIFGAMSSLLFNIVGSALVGQHPLELIRVYLTFPLGDKALELDSGLALAVGCCLYLGTGMLLGIPVYLALTRWTADGSSRQAADRGEFRVR